MAEVIPTHNHPVVDTARPFVIDPVTKEIKAGSNNLTLPQRSKNSERFTFTIHGTTIEGHDMTLCNSVMIHFRNIGQETGQLSKGIYKVKDLTVANGSVTLSWLIDEEATLYAGGLSFSIHFICTAEDGSVVYDLPTLSYSRITVGPTVWNSDTIAKKHPDIIAELDGRITALNALRNSGLVNTKEVAFTKTEGYRVRGDGLLVEVGGYYYTDLIPLAKSERIHVEAQMPSTNYTAIVSIWSGEDTFVRTLASGSAATEFNLDYIAEADCYIRLCGYNGFKMDAKISTFNEFNYSFAESAIKDTAREVSREVAIVSAFVPSYQKVENRYIINDGTINGSADFYYSSLIELKIGQVLSVVSKMPNNNRFAVVSRWTADGIYIETLFCPKATGLQTFDYTATEVTEYIRVCGYADLTLEVVIKEVFESNLAMLKEELGLETSEGLRGVKWDCFGDSLTAPGTIDYADNYTNIIANKNGMDMKNNAVGGKGWWNGILAELDNLRSETDVVTIFGSFNDIDSVAFPDNVGTKADTPSASGSLCARMRNIIETIITANPAIKIGIITPTPWSNYNYFTADTDTYARLETYVSTLKEVAEIYGIPVLDLFHESNMKPWIESFRNTYYKQNWDSETETYTGGDGVHPNTLGHKMFIAPKVEAFLKSIVCNY